MNIYEAFESKTLVDGGKWFPLSPDSEIKLLYMGSDASKRAYDNLMRSYAQRQKLGIDLTEEEATSVNVTFLSETLVLDWKGIKDKEGRDLPFSKEAVAVLCKALPRFAALILRIATDETGFEKELVEEEVGNSSTT
jgi:hypothetical protein